MHSNSETTGLEQEQQPAKYKVEVIADSSGTWAGNGLRFDSHQEATVYAMDLASRWTAVREWRVVEIEA